MSPNLVIDDTSQGPGGVAAITIRGIGVADVEKSFDPAIGVVIDGVFIGSNTGGILKSFDIASIEVLRGPQGTLFGRNTIGGVINVTRSKPTGKFGGKVRAGYGDYDTYDHRRHPQLPDHSTNSLRSSVLAPAIRAKASTRTSIRATTWEARTTGPSASTCIHAQ